jgi:hypothetical protein
MDVVSIEHAVALAIRLASTFRLLCFGQKKLATKTMFLVQRR